MAIEARKIRIHVEAAKSGLPPHMGQRLQLALNTMDKTKGQDYQRAISHLAAEANRIKELYDKRPSYAPKPEAVVKHLDPLIALLQKAAENAA